MPNVPTCTAYVNQQSLLSKIKSFYRSLRATSKCHKILIESLSGTVLTSVMQMCGELKILLKPPKLRNEKCYNLCQLKKQSQFFMPRKKISLILCQENFLDSQSKWKEEEIDETVFSRTKRETESLRNCIAQQLWANVIHIAHDIFKTQNEIKNSVRMIIRMVIFF